jgi:hypothetical protein
MSARCTYCRAYLPAQPLQVVRGLGIWVCARCNQYHDDEGHPGVPNQNEENHELTAR